jgi:hypothetical protein
VHPARHPQETKAAGGEVTASGFCAVPPADSFPPTAEPEHHPAAALFPLLRVDSPEFRELVAGIGEQGLLQPNILHEGKILDGRDSRSETGVPARDEGTASRRRDAARETTAHGFGW